MQARYQVLQDQPGSLVLLDLSEFTYGCHVPDPNLAKDISTVASALIVLSDPITADRVATYFRTLADHLEPRQA